MKFNFLNVLTSSNISLFLIIFQSCGIRFFEGQGIFCSILILFLLIPISYRHIGIKDIAVLLYIALFLILNKIINEKSSLSMIIYQFMLVIEAFLLIKSYKNQLTLVQDFYISLTIIFIHSLFGYIIYLIFPQLFTDPGLNMPYKAFFNIFYVMQQKDGLVRNTGILWEPGLLQLMLHLLIFLSVKLKKNPFLILIISITLLTTQSTVGFLILGLNIIYYLVQNINFKNVYILTILSFFLITASQVFLFVQNNIYTKFSGDNTSGLVRLRDFKLGLNLIQESPIIGHGLFDSKYLASKPYTIFLESQVFSDTYLDLSGAMSGGFTNGFLGIFCWYGLPAGIYIYYLFFKNKVFSNNLTERIVFFLIICLTCISEPITYTAFFLLFPMSVLISYQKSNLKNKKVLNTYV